jgi:hypothetical protein
MSMNTHARFLPLFLAWLLCAAPAAVAAVAPSPAEFFAPEKPIASRLTDEIIRGVALEQEFVPVHDYLRSFGIHINPYNRPNVGTLVFDLREKGSPSPLAMWKLDVSKITSEELKYFRFPTQPHSKGKRYVLTISSPDGAPGSSLRLWLHRLYDGDEAETYSFGGNRLQGRIVLKLTYAPNPWVKALPYLLGIPAGVLAVAWLVLRPARLAPPLKLGLALASLAPAVFIILMIQRGAVTAPFGDHVALGQYFIIPYYQGNLSYAAFLGPHNHTRPLVYRAVYFANALLTDWDLRSEYVYHTASLLLTLLAHAWLLFAVLGRRFSVLFFAALTAVSVFVFSPVGQNNHWWSMMSQLTFASLLIAFALAALIARGNRWSGDVLAALGCWLATYTITNGLFAFVACAAVSQLRQVPVYRPSRSTFFWIANIVVCAIVYLPGLPETAAGAQHGSPATIAQFCLVYLGLPLSGMIRYPYVGPFHVPTETLFPAVTGAALLALTAFSAVYRRDLILRRTPAGLAFVGFTTFAVLSALGTAWGRAGVEHLGGVVGANSSRYSIYASYLVLGLIVFWCGALREAHAALPAPDSKLPAGVQALRFALAAAFLALLPLAYRTYRDSIRVYDDIHEFNRLVWYAYQHAESVNDSMLYPDVKLAREFKRNLYRLRLGPYNTRD